MGSGDLVGSRFHLIVSLRYAPEPGELAFLCDVFNRASQILADATDGVLSIGTVEIATHSQGGDRADIWIHPLEAVAPNSQAARLWLRGTSMDISQRFLIHPTLLVHELGHYLFGLGDEYAVNDPAAHCRNDIAQQASLMEAYGWGNFAGWVDSSGTPFVTWPMFFAAYANGDADYRQGQPTEFCHAPKHSTHPNPHNATWNDRSCWEVIADDATHHQIPYGLTQPASTGPRKRKPKAPPATTCVELLAVERSMIRVGPGRSIRGDDELTTAAAFWVDAARTGEHFGIAAGAGQGLIGTPVAPIPADPEGSARWRAARRSALYGSRSERGFARGDAVRDSLVDVTRGGRATRQQIVLVAATGEPPPVDELLDLLPAVRAAGVRVDLVANADEPDLGVLAETALVTGGRLLVSDRENGSSALEAASGLIGLAGESRDNGAIISVVAARSRRTGARVRAEPRAGGAAFDVPVTEGSSMATIGAAWPGSTAQLDVEVLDPAGARVTPADGTSLVTGTGRYAFVQVENPMPGTWRVRVIGQDDDAEILPIALEVNARVSLDVSLVHAHVRVGEPIELRATLRVPEPVPGATIVADVVTPAGDLVRIPFTEHAGEPGDPEPPASYTASIDTAAYGAGAYAIEVHAERAAGEIAVGLDGLYSLDPAVTPERLKRSIRIPAIRRMTAFTAVADDAGRTARDPIAGWDPSVRG